MLTQTADAVARLLASLVNQHSCNAQVHMHRMATQCLQHQVLPAHRSCKLWRRQGAAGHIEGQIWGGRRRHDWAPTELLQLCVQLSSTVRAILGALKACTAV